MYANAQMAHANNVIFNIRVEAARGYISTSDDHKQGTQHTYVNIYLRVLVCTAVVVTGRSGLCRSLLAVEDRKKQAGFMSPNNVMIPPQHDGPVFSATTKQRPGVTAVLWFTKP